MERYPVAARQVLKSYASNISTLAKKRSMMADVGGIAETIDEKTFDDYVGAMEKLLLLEDIRGWCLSIRSAIAMKSGQKREFIEPLIAVAALGLSPASFRMDLKTLPRSCLLFNGLLLQAPDEKLLQILVRCPEQIITHT